MYEFFLEPYNINRMDFSLTKNIKKVDLHRGIFSVGNLFLEQWFVDLQIIILVCSLHMTDISKSHTRQSFLMSLQIKEHKKNVNDGEKTSLKLTKYSLFNAPDFVFHNLNK